MRPESRLNNDRLFQNDVLHEESACEDCHHCTCQGEVGSSVESPQHEIASADQGLQCHTFKVQLYIQTIVNLKTIVDHCPQNFENHRKTIDTNGWALKKHSMVIVQRCQNHRKTIEVNGGLKKNINHSIALKN